MCKVFAMTNMSNVKVNAKFIRSVKDMVCKYSDDDGFGYAVLGKKGTIGGERTMKPNMFRPLQDNPNDKVVHKLPIAQRSSDAFGKIDLRNPKAFIAHGRLSTNTVSLRNTHPFTNGELALVHNGVVYDPAKKIKNLTTNCDTEILLRYWENGGFDLIEENVTGYYAMAVIDKAGMLHIVRDDRAMLYISYSPTVDSYIISTTAEIIAGVCKANKWKFETPEEMLDCTYAMFNGNEIVEHKEIFPRGTGSKGMTRAEMAALGREFDDSDGSEGWQTSSPYRGGGQIIDATKGETGSGSQSTAMVVADSTASSGETDPEAEPEPDYREETERDRYERQVLEREMDEQLANQMASDEMPALDYNRLDREEYKYKPKMRIKDVVEQMNENLNKRHGFRRNMA